MRPELKNVRERDYWCYGLGESDFDYVVGLVSRFVDLSVSRVKDDAERTLRECDDPSISCEIISDDAHYAWVDQQYLWDFALWRLQGILEGIIVYGLLEAKAGAELRGLKRKLDAIEEAGFSLTPGERQELLDWADVRNAISHAPPEQFRPGPLRKGDIEEFCALLKRLSNRWMQEKERHNSREHS